MMQVLLCILFALLGMTNGLSWSLTPAEQRSRERYGVLDVSNPRYWNWLESDPSCDKALNKHKELYGAGTSSRQQMQAALGNCERCYCLRNSPVFGDNRENGWDEESLPYLRCDNCYDTQHEDFHDHDKTRDIRIEQGLPYFDENHNLQISHGLVAKQLLKHRYEFEIEKCNRLLRFTTFEDLINGADPDSDYRNCLKRMEEAGITLGPMDQSRDGFYYGGLDMSDYGGDDGFVPAFGDDSDDTFDGFGSDWNFDEGIPSDEGFSFGPSDESVPFGPSDESVPFGPSDEGVPDLTEKVGDSFDFSDLNDDGFDFSSWKDS